MLYETAGSWFDPQRPRRLEFDDESLFVYISLPKGSCHLPRLARRFDKPGKYLVEIGTLEGQAASGHVYQLRIVPVKHSGNLSKWYPVAPAHQGPDWQDKEFTRKIGPDRLRTLWSRTVSVPKKNEKMTAEGSLANSSGRARTHQCGIPPQYGSFRCPRSPQFGA